MMSWYEMIKQQWNMGWYSDPAQLDIYVQAGWITEEEKQKIITPEPMPNYPVDTGTDEASATETTPTAPTTDSTTESIK